MLNQSILESYALLSVHVEQETKRNVVKKTGMDLVCVKEGNDNER